jgi:hypothetical protein
MAACQPFSIMRLTHEAIRSGLNDVAFYAENLSTENVAELRKSFQEVKRIIELHAKQEDNKFYPPLMEKEPGITEAFSQEHADESLHFNELEDLLLQIQTDDTLFQSAKIAVNKWVADHRSHLEHEEGVLMAILPKVFTYVESVEVVRGILDYDVEEFEHFHLPWVFARLKGPQREMYLGMLKGCSPNGKYPDFENKIMPLLTEEERMSLNN